MQDNQQSAANIKSKKILGWNPAPSSKSTLGKTQQSAASIKSKKNPRLESCTQQQVYTGIMHPAASLPTFQQQHLQGFEIIPMRCTDWGSSGFLLFCPLRLCIRTQDKFWIYSYLRMDIGRHGCYEIEDQWMPVDVSDGAGRGLRQRNVPRGIQHFQLRLLQLLNVPRIEFSATSTYNVDFTAKIGGKASEQIWGSLTQLKYANPNPHFSEHPA
ncbi:unnamed protein product [Prunus armeniaca]|uniref:Uncharacterized protein n=1 Tax=Prunus armeniaca TaxID=36596 RepID=A0A6J5TK91_PRUAR|nr:unnamed protein product [Prunus armeniaca]